MIIQSFENSFLNTRKASKLYATNPLMIQFLPLYHPTMHLPHVPRCIIQDRNVHFSSEWCFVGYGTGAVCDLRDWSIGISKQMPRKLNCFNIEAWTNPSAVSGSHLSKKYIFLPDTRYISIQISLEFVHKGPVDKKRCFRAMAWPPKRQQAHDDPVH